GSTSVPICVAGILLKFVTRDQALARKLSEYFFEYSIESSSTSNQVATEVLIETHRPEPGAIDIWEEPDPEFHSDGDFVFHRDFVARKITDSTNERWMVRITTEVE